MLMLDQEIEIIIICFLHINMYIKQQSKLRL